MCACAAYGCVCVDVCVCVCTFNKLHRVVDIYFVEH